MFEFGMYARHFFPPCSTDHERERAPCKVFFRVGNQYAECKKQQRTTTNVLKFSLLTGGCSEGLDAFIFFFKQQSLKLPELPDVLV